MTATALRRYAAIRPFDPTLGTGTYIDLSTLSDTADGARALAEREDRRNHMAIRRGERLAHLRVAPVEIREAH